MPVFAESAAAAAAAAPIPFFTSVKGSLGGRPRSRRTADKRWATAGSREEEEEEEEELELPATPPPPPKPYLLTTPTSCRNRVETRFDHSCSADASANRLGSAASSGECRYRGGESPPEKRRAETASSVRPRKTEKRRISASTSTTVKPEAEATAETPRIGGVASIVSSSSLVVVVAVASMEFSSSSRSWREEEEEAEAKLLLSSPPPPPVPPRRRTLPLLSRLPLLTR